MSRMCPRDDSPMRERQIDDKLSLQQKHKAQDIRIDECLDCKGIFFDKDEAEAAIGADQALLNLSSSFKLPMPCNKCQKNSSPGSTTCEHCQAPIGIVCPGCQKRMYLIDVLGIEVDACGHCHGLWFDAGEVKKLQRRYRRQFRDLDTTPETTSPPPQRQTKTQTQDNNAKDEKQPTTFTCKSCQKEILPKNAYKTKEGYYCRKCFPSQEGSSWIAADPGDPGESSVTSNLITAWATMEIIDAVTSLFGDES